MKYGQQFGGIALPGTETLPFPTWNFGWRNDPAAVQAVLATLPFPTFDVAAPNLKGTGAGKNGLLYLAAQKVLGKDMPAQQQPRGTCVSRGWSRAVDYVQLVEIALRNIPEEFAYVSHACVYGMAKEIGGDLSYQDGAVGAWAAKAVSQWGVCTNEECGDVEAGNDDLAVQWGGRGVPVNIKQLAKDNLVKVTTLVTKPEDARDMLVNGYPLSVCSDQGFTMTRDSGGRCAPQGSWSHCMMWSAYRDDTRQFLVEQSWGSNTPSGPRPGPDGSTIPDNAFWIDWNVAGRMLSQEDSFALSAFGGFKMRNLDWGTIA